MISRGSFPAEDIPPATSTGFAASTVRNDPLIALPQIIYLVSMQSALENSVSCAQFVASHRLYSTYTPQALQITLTFMVPAATTLTARALF